MKTLHQFKVGDQVQVKPEDQEAWKNFKSHQERDRVQYQVVEVAPHPGAEHARLDDSECVGEGCIHSLVHDQILTLDATASAGSENMPIRASGAWFIPVTE